MTSKEMFEALGYEQTVNSNDLIKYMHDSNGDGDYKYISFIHAWKHYEVGFFDYYNTKTTLYKILKK